MKAVPDRTVTQGIPNQPQRRSKEQPAEPGDMQAQVKGADKTEQSQDNADIGGELLDKS